MSHFSLVAFKIFSFVLFWLYTWHVEVPGPGIKPKPQQWPKPLQWQYWILNPIREPKRTPSPFVSLIVKCVWEFLLWLNRLRTWLASMRMWVWTLALLSGLRIQWAVALVTDTASIWCDCGSDSTPSLEASICSRCGPKKNKREKEKKKVCVGLFWVCHISLVFTFMSFIKFGKFSGNISDSTSPCAQLTVKPNKLKCQSLEQKKVYCQAMQGDGRFVPSKYPSLPQRKLQSIFLFLSFYGCTCAIWTFPG